MSTYGKSSSHPRVAVLPSLPARSLRRVATLRGGGRWLRLSSWRSRLLTHRTLHDGLDWVRSAPWKLLSGPLLTLGLAVMFGLLWLHGAFPMHPMELMLAAVVYAMCVGGVRPGLLSAAIALACDAYYIFRVVPAVDVGGTALGDAVVVGLSVPACVLLLASLRHQAELTWAEREQRVREHAVAESLRRAQSQMDEALSLTSHELRTPLATVKLSGQQAARTLRKISARSVTSPDLTPTSRPDAGRNVSVSTDEHLDPAVFAQVDGALDCLAKVDANVRRLDRMIGDLLDASRVRSDHLALHPVPCDLTALVADVVAEQCALFPERTVTVGGAVRPVLIDADPLRVAQVLGNFLSNAFKYSPADQPTEVVLHVEGDVARVTVRDHGPGIPPAMRERIWERFERGIFASAPTSAAPCPTGGGLGLGLYLSRGLIERSGGTVGVDSSVCAEDHGSTFWLSLPLLCA